MCVNVPYIDNQFLHVGTDERKMNEGADKEKKQTLEREESFERGGSTTIRDDQREEGD